MPTNIGRLLSPKHCKNFSDIKQLNKSEIKTRDIIAQLNDSTKGVILTIGDTHCTTYSVHIPLKTMNSIIRWYETQQIIRK
jgi:hypothetical protein